MVAARAEPSRPGHPTSRDRVITCPSGFDRLPCPQIMAAMRFELLYSPAGRVQHLKRLLLAAMVPSDQRSASRCARARDVPPRRLPHCV